jgi:hypothetical protein
MQILISASYNTTGFKSRQPRRIYEDEWNASNAPEALHAAVRRHAREAAFIQRCQVYKKPNVVDHLPDEHKADVKRKLQNAYAMADYADGNRRLLVSE